MIETGETVTFSDAGDFVAFGKAEKLLRGAGFSYGSMQRNEPIGVMFGSGWQIAKWRNLSEKERAQLHGQITGVSKRAGPISVTIFATAPQAARDAFNKAMNP